MNQPARAAPKIDTQAILIQGDSVRMAWGADNSEQQERELLRRDGPPASTPAGQTEDVSRLRLSEELDYPRRTLDVTGDRITSGPIALSRNSVALQSLDNRPTDAGPHRKPHPVERSARRCCTDGHVGPEGTA